MGIEGNEMSEMGLITTSNNELSWGKCDYLQIEMTSAGC